MTPSHTVSALERKQPSNFGLDLLRALAITPVLILHGSDYLPLIKTCLSDGYLWNFGMVGWSCSTGLLGFLIGGLLLSYVSSGRSCT